MVLYIYSTKTKLGGEGEYMNVKLNIIKKELESLRMVLHFLLNFKKPTDKMVVCCSQQLDEVIVRYQKIKATSKKVA